MKRTHIGLIICIATSFLILLCGSERLKSEPKKNDARIEEIKSRHESICETSRLGIMAGYFACSRGLDFTNYMAKVESEWKRQLDEKISKAISIR